MRSVLLFISILLSQLLAAQQQYKFDFTGKTLFDAVQELSKKCELKFSYNPKVLKAYRIDRKIKAYSNAELISDLFEGLPFKIQLLGGVYLLIPKENDFKPSTLIGKVYDQHTGKPLSHAHIQMVNRGGTISNWNGVFTLPPRKDTLTLLATYVGYQPVKVEVSPIQNEITLSLTHDLQTLLEVVLRPEEYDNMVGQMAGVFDLGPNQLNGSPAIGETDVLKSIQLLPGVNATNEASQGISIRGSDPTQSQILMDGFKLYQPSHFFGIFSTLNPSIIRNVKVYKGGFGAEYGGSTSSVIDVSGKAGSMEKLSVGADVSLLSVNGHLETPLGNKTSLIIGGRRSFTGVINGLYKNFVNSSRGYLLSGHIQSRSSFMPPLLQFYDVNGKLRHRFSDQSFLDVNLLVSKNSYRGGYDNKFENSGATGILYDRERQKSVNIGASWKKIFSPQWTMDMTVGATQYEGNTNFISNYYAPSEVITDNDTFPGGVDSNNYMIKNTVNDLTIKSSHTITLNSRHVIKAGVELNDIETRYYTKLSYYHADQVPSHAQQNVLYEDMTLSSTNHGLKADIFNVYGEHQFKSSRLLAILGVRGSYYKITNKWYAEPRLNIRFDLSDNLYLKGATSYHHQFVGYRPSFITENTSQVYWALADNLITPVQKASHIILGMNYTIDSWVFDIEYYLKKTTGINTSQFLTSSLPDVDLPPGDLPTETTPPPGKNAAEGLDVLVKYQSDKYVSWLSYSLGRSEDHFWYMNNNNPYPSRLDQRHELSFVNVLKTGKWKFSSTFIYGTGRPYMLPFTGKIKQKRLPPYVRLDVAAAYSFDIGKFKCELGVSCFNALGYLNIKSKKILEHDVFDQLPSGHYVFSGTQHVEVDSYLPGLIPNIFFNIKI